MAATAFLGFAPTYWAPLAQGVPEKIGVLAVHGTVFFGWTLFVIYQAWLVATGKVARHRDVGLIGVSLATAMVIFGVLAAINSATRAAAIYARDAGEAFTIVPLSAMFLFGVLMIAAIANTRRPEWHKRLILAATAATLEAPIARPFIVYIVMGGHPPPFQGTVGLAGFGGPPPPVMGVLPPALIALLFIVIGMARDWRVLGKPHPAYLWAGGLALPVLLLRGPFSDTQIWHGFARSLIALAG
ncbi:MAG: hypothetical protein ACXWK7_19625 [Caulobacteraceae bacterium]